MLCFACTASAASCGVGNRNSGGNNSAGGKPSGSISVICYEAGFGTKWLDEMAEEFSSALGVTVKVKKSYVNGELISLLNDNSQNDDVVMALGSMFAPQDSGFLTDLSPVYNSVPEGETKTIKETMNPAIYNKLLTEDGKIYQMNWADPVCGIVINKTVLDRIFPMDIKYRIRRTN